MPAADLIEPFGDPHTVYRALEAATLALHLVWIAWILLGWWFTRGRPLLAGLHIGHSSGAL